MEKKTYDAAFKKEAIRLVEEQGEKAATVARKLGVTNKTMYRSRIDLSSDRAIFTAAILNCLS